MTNNANTATATIVAKRGRKEIFEKPELLLKALGEISTGNFEGDKPTATYFIKRRLAEQGLIEFVAIKGEGRGRPRHEAQLTVDGEQALAAA